jgi:hypothetical protein
VTTTFSLTDTIAACTKFLGKTIHLVACRHLKTQHPGCGNFSKHADEAEEEVVMKDMDHAKLKNKIVKQKKRVAGKTGPELSSEEELTAQFSAVTRRENQGNW